MILSRWLCALMILAIGVRPGSPASRKREEVVEDEEEEDEEEEGRVRPPR